MSDIPKKAQKMCYDKILPGDLHRPHMQRSMGGDSLEAIAVARKTWANGSTITIAFLEGTEHQISEVKKHAVEWMDHANLKFEFVDSLPAMIRIAFNPNDGAWSYVGTDNLGIPTPGPTMNFGWIDKETILHEFGHMIGLAHEHQNPEGGIIWNEAEVIRSLKGPPNFWDEPTIRHNVLNKYQLNQLNGTNFDPDSIMLYPFPAGWTQNMDGTKNNQELSATDKAFVAGANMYPGASSPTPAPSSNKLTVSPVTNASIDTAGEVDTFTFDVATAGVHIIETTGTVDLKISVFGPDNPGNLIAQDDDSGVGTNSRIEMMLSPGEYHVKVNAFSTDVRGEYSIHVLNRAA